MLKKQRTIAKSVSYSGIGLHTGETSTITFHPAPEGYGYKFVRTDLEEAVEIPALVEHVVDLSRGTTLGIGDVKVHTVEHVLSALAGLQVSNCRIELSGIEPPIGDGSAMPYVKALLEAGFEEQEQDIQYFEIPKNIRYQNDEKEVDLVALPNEDLRITIMVDYHNPALGSQHTGLFDMDEFVDEFASARTFCFLTEIETLWDHGLIQGGKLDNAIVIVDKEVSPEELEMLGKRFQLDRAPEASTNGILNNAKLRFRNEPARHKLLDLLGDLALVGVPLKGQILAAHPGHAMNFEFAKKIRAEYLKQKKFEQYSGGHKDGIVLDINGLLDIMPHRYPFLMIDRVVDIDFENNTITGLKNVTVNEPFFQGHFPEIPVMPGVMICEALAQTGCLLLLKTLDDFRSKLVLFAAIRNAKFRKPVIPGDQLIMKVEMKGKRFNTYSFHAKALVDNQVVAELDFQAASIDKEQK